MAVDDPTYRLALDRASLQSEDLQGSQRMYSSMLLNFKVREAGLAGDVWWTKQASGTLIHEIFDKASQCYYRDSGQSGQCRKFSCLRLEVQDQEGSKRYMDWNEVVVVKSILGEYLKHFGPGISIFCVPE